LFCAKKFIQWDLDKVSAGVCPHVLVDVLIARIVIVKVVGGLVCEATQACVGFGGRFSWWCWEYSEVKEWWTANRMAMQVVHCVMGM